MSVIESSANHPSLLEMVGTLSSYLLIVVCLQHAIQWIVNKFNMVSSLLDIQTPNYCKQEVKEHNKVLYGVQP